MQLLKSGVDFGSRLDTRVLEDQVEIHPPAAGVVGRADRLRNVEALLGVRFSRGEGGGIDGDAAGAKSLADSRPVGIDQHATRVEKNRLEHVSRASRSGPRCPST